MGNFDQIFTLLAEHEGHKGIGLNTDILETGLINIIAVIAILVSYAQQSLRPYLKERRETIINGVKDAENRLNEAQKRLTEAEKQFNQANLIISEIRNETTATKEVLLESDASQAKNDLTIRFERALANLNSKERQIFLEIKQQIISIVLQRTVRRMTQSFKSQERATKLINESINKLEGDLL